MPNLYDPIKIGNIELRNRIVMAPLTRARAIGGGRVPNTLMRDYYVQRATAGLIITEATSVTPMGVGYENTPGLWSEEQVAGWRVITDAVHAAGGKIVSQLWHVGRISDPELLGGELPVAPSAIAPEGHVSLLRPKRPYTTPRALETDEIPGIVAAYRRGAENAKRAGFDGVEVHGANGYLLDQFLQDASNKRTDRYGGSIDNRARLMLEVTDACIEVWGASRVGMHLNPRMDSHSMGDSTPRETFAYVARELDRRGVAFICARAARDEWEKASTIRDVFSGAYIANQDFTREQGEEVVASGKADAVAYGRPFIANPDLPRRFAEHAPLNPLRPETLYGDGPEGYVDYPALEPALA